MKVVPLMDRVLIKPIEAIQKSNGGIVLTGDNSKVTYLHGEILAMGPGKQKANGDYVATPLEVGDRVIYGNVSSTLEDMQNGEKVLLVESNAIVAKLVDDVPDSPHAHLSLAIT